MSAVLASMLLAGALTTESTFTGTPESQRALDLIEQRLGHKEPIRDIVIVHSATQTVDQAQFRQRVEALRAQLAKLEPGVVRVGPTYYETHAPPQVSDDRHSTLIPLSMPGSQVNDADTRIAPVVALVDRANGQSGFRSS